MPYKNKAKQQEAVRKAVKKHRARKRREMQNMARYLQTVHKSVYNDVSKRFPILFPKKKRLRGVEARAEAEAEIDD